jgi:thiamine-phosphate pyrophosphorylase
MYSDGAAPDIFYPIVPDADWLARLVPLGVRTIQLRIKEAGEDEVRRQIAASLDITRASGCQLIVNDYWREAIEMGADYVHLGQEDLAAADLTCIKRAGLRLGISTHSEAELAIALDAQPDYVALGPIYETKLKVMKWSPQGLDRIGAWKARVGALPLIAIGGITPERAPGVIGAGAQSVAVITDFFTASDPEARVRAWLAWADGARRDANAAPADDIEAKSR